MEVEVEAEVEVECLEVAGRPEELLRVDMPCWEHRLASLLPKMEGSVERHHRSTREIAPTPTSLPMSFRSTKT